MLNKNSILKILFTIAICGCFFWIYQSFQEAYSIKTATNARPEDVRFLKLPTSASRIGYWRDGLNYWAEFDLPEKDFRRTFSKYHFEEIAEPIEVRPKTFGEPKVFPPHNPASPIKISSGLRYQERWDNGGGYDILYDRSRSRAYYNSSRR